MHPSHRRPRTGCGQGSHRGLTHPRSHPTHSGRTAPRPSPAGKGVWPAVENPAFKLDSYLHSLWASVGRTGREPSQRGHGTPFSVMIKTLDTPLMHKCFHLQYWKARNTLNVFQGVFGSFPNPTEIPNSWKLSIPVFQVPLPKALVLFLDSVFVFLFFSLTIS